MKLFLDTNIIIDLVSGRQPFGHDAGLLYRLRLEPDMYLMVSDLTIFNTAYSLRKEHFPKEEIFDILQSILPNLIVLNMGRSVIERSLQKRGKDFEDDAQYFSAVDAGADYIITRNKKDFPQEDFVLEPKEFFDLMNIEC